ncbi:thioredoxin domain-containing protein [Chitinispirillales bacterium ANBcel5]|uniref:thioredoxin family protein n=1 Tax=Cellulosispirillum alkaliphilum TaxID=3039283 RepID=UPI002A58483B|nr:thioredoxin domain-containing protein [Chitinispirillales bacterium ANBcel5]
MVVKKLANVGIVVLSFVLFHQTKTAAEVQGARIDSSQQIAETIIESDTPVLVDFWAVWCPPCYKLNPIIEELKEKYSDRILFMKVDVDVHKAIAQYFGVTSIPTVFLIHDKNVIEAIPGVRSKDYYIDRLEALLDKATEDQ